MVPDLGLQSEDRRRAQAVVKQVAEALEDREDLAEELEEARDKAEDAEARAIEAEAAAEKARSDARGEVAAERDEEQRAVLAALGLAEERAVQMAAECETLREEKAGVSIFSHHNFTHAPSLVYFYIVHNNIKKHVF